MFDMERGCIPYDYEPPLKKTRAKYFITPEMHEKIKKLYQTRTINSGEVRTFAQKYKLPRWKVTRYATQHGWIGKTRKEPDWSETELNILEHNAHHCPERIQLRLRVAGFYRSVAGIVLKRKRMRYLQNINGNTATSLAMCLGEDNHFVLRHIKLGHLKAQRRIQNRTSQQGGPAYLIRDKDVKDFILKYPDLIDLRKVDKHWFISILTEDLRG
jgi:hypothetical protein